MPIIAATDDLARLIAVFDAFAAFLRVHPEEPIEVGAASPALPPAPHSEH